MSAPALSCQYYHYHNHLNYFYNAITLKDKCKWNVTAVRALIQVGRTLVQITTHYHKIINIIIENWCVFFGNKLMGKNNTLVTYWK